MGGGPSFRSPVRPATLRPVPAPSSVAPPPHLDEDPTPPHTEAFDDEPTDPGEAPSSMRPTLGPDEGEDDAGVTDDLGEPASDLGGVDPGDTEDTGPIELPS
jgi:hypothetical protein